MIELRANAKINLFLRVLERRADGFHEIEGVFQSVSLADDLKIESNNSGKIELSMRYADGRSGIPIPSEENTVYRAAIDLVARRRTDAGLSISLVKRIPSGAGLGGGSSDAAATLLALNEMWGLGLTPNELQVMGAELGSDVPYCLSGGAMLVTGRGEGLAPLSTVPEKLWLVLGISDEPLLTATVYRHHDSFSRRENGGYGPDLAHGTVQNVNQNRTEAMIDALAVGDTERIAATLHNDLEPAAFDLRPELPEKKQAMVGAGALGALMSGSGPTIFGVCRDEVHARSVADGLGSTFDRVEVIHTTQVSVEPGTEHA